MFIKVTNAKTRLDARYNVNHIVFVTKATKTDGALIWDVTDTAEGSTGFETVESFDEVVALLSNAQNYTNYTHTDGDPAELNRLES